MLVDVIVIKLMHVFLVFPVMPVFSVCYNLLANTHVIVINASVFRVSSDASVFSVLQY